MDDVLDVIAKRDLSSTKGLAALRGELAADESPLMAINARPDSDVTNGILLLTTRRLLLVKRGAVNSRTIEIPLSDVRSIERRGSVLRKIAVEHPEATIFAVDVSASQVDVFVAAVDVARRSLEPSPPQAHGEAPSPSGAGLTFVDVTGGDWLAVVGESRYQPALAALVDDPRFRGDLVIPTWAVLVAEPSNAHDSNAVQVVIRNQRVGYLSRDNALRFAPFFAANVGAFCPAIVRGPAAGRGVTLRVDYRLLEDPGAGEHTAVDDLLWT